MARALQFDKDQALDRVMNEIWHSGYDANSVKAISEKLGITRSSYYNSFGSREALFKTVLLRYAKASPDYALFDTKKAEDPLALITTVFRNAVARRMEDGEARGCMAVNSIASLVGSHDELGPALQELAQASLARLTELLELARDKRELESDIQPQVLAVALQSNLMGLNLLSKIVRSEEELWAATKANLEGLGVYKGDKGGEA